MGSPFADMTAQPEDVALWPLVQHKLVACLYQALRPLLSERYVARIGQRRSTAEGPPAASGSRPDAYEEYIEIRDRDNDLLITLLDVVSPASKTSETSRFAFLATRAQALALHANVVEIDLVRLGRPREEHGANLPDWDYVVTVTRSSRPEHLEVYAAEFPLPRFRIPLASDDVDIVLDVSDAVAHAFDQDRFDSATISTDERWLRAQLGPRPGQAPDLGDPPRSFPEPVMLTHENIAVAAYYLWEHEGYPRGRDVEHWYRAIDQLMRVRRPHGCFPNEQ